MQALCSTLPWLQSIEIRSKSSKPVFARAPEDECVLWVGAGTKDIGFSLTRLTFQFTHATDSDTNAERDYIMNELREHDVIENVTLHKTGDQLLAENVNHYITDGEVAVAGLVDRCELEESPDFSA
jgi:hypothetical protein